MITFYSMQKYSHLSRREYTIKSIKYVISILPWPAQRTAATHHYHTSYYKDCG